MVHGGERPATQGEVHRWNQLVERNPDGGNVFQGSDFAEHKSLTGWRARYAMVNGVAVSILEKPVPGLGRLWYLPKGPGVSDSAQLVHLLPALTSLAAASGAFVVKLEPEIPASDAARRALTEMGLVKVPDVQPNSSTVIVDISEPVDEVVASFAAKTRSNIRAADRAGVQTGVVPATDANCATFYDLLATTALDRFRIRSQRYYRLYWQRHERSGAGVMLFATVDDRVVAADFLMLVGNDVGWKQGCAEGCRQQRGKDPRRCRLAGSGGG